MKKIRHFFAVALRDFAVWLMTPDKFPKLFLHVAHKLDPELDTEIVEVVESRY